MSTQIDPIKRRTLYYKSNKIPIFLCLIGPKIHVKVTKILRICRKKYCEYRPSGVHNWINKNAYKGGRGKFLLI